MEIDQFYNYEIKKSFIGCYSSDGEKMYIPKAIRPKNGPSLYDIYDIKSGYCENITGVALTSHLVNYDVLFNCRSYNVGIDTTKALFSISNSQKSSRDSEIPLVVNPFPRRVTKVEKWCCAVEFSLLFFSSGSKIYVINLTDGSFHHVKYDILSFESYEKKNNPLNMSISSLQCHPTKPILNITTIINGNHFILFFHFTNLISRLGSNDNEEDGADTETASETGSVVSSSITNSTFTMNAKSLKSLDLVAQSIIKAPSVSSGCRLMKMCYHKSGSLLAVSWEKDNKFISIYDMRFIGIEVKPAIKSIEPLFKSCPYPSDIQTTGLCFHSQEPYLIHTYRNVSVKDSSGLQFIRVVSLLSNTLPSILVENITNSFLTSTVKKSDLLVSDVNSSYNSGKILLMMNTTTQSINVYCIQLVLKFTQKFTSQMSLHIPWSSKISVPPDVYLDGDQSLKREEQPDNKTNKDGKDSKEMPSLNTSAVTITTVTTATTRAKAWPFVLIINKSTDLSSGGLRLSYHLFRTGLGLGVNMEDSNTTKTQSMISNESKPYKYLGKIPSFINSEQKGELLSTGDDLSIFQPEDTYFQPGYFIPNELKLNELVLNSSIGFVDDILVSTTLSLSSTLTKRLSFEALIRGTVMSITSATSSAVATTTMSSLSSSSSIHTIVESHRMPIVCFIRYESVPDTLLPSSSFRIHDNYTLQPVYTSFRDADFWTGASASVRSASKDWPSGILALSSDGLSVKWITLGMGSSTSGVSESTGKVAGMWRFDYEMRLLWTAPLGAPNVILYVSSANINTPETLYLSTRGSPALESTYKHFPLRDGEYVLEAIWQSIPTAFGSKSKITPSEVKHNQRLWLTSFTGPMLGIRTNYRVLLLTSTLELMNCYWHSKPSELISMRKNSISSLSPSSSASIATSLNTPMNNLSGHDNSVISISWIGCALVYASKNGSISYLLPALRLRNISLSPPNRITFTRLRSLGLSEEDFGKGRLCSISNHIESMRIIACLPDRLLFLCNTDDNSNNDNSSSNGNSLDFMISKVTIRTRPIIVAEPVILGLLIRGLGLHNISNITENVNPHSNSNQNSSINMNINAITQSLPSTSILGPTLSPTPLPILGSTVGFGSHAILSTTTSNQSMVSSVKDDHHKQDKYSMERLEVLAKIAILYYSNKSYTSSDGRTIFSPSSHSTQKLIIALSESGYNSIACIISHIPSDKDAKGIGFPISGDFPSHRWITNSLKCDISIRSGRGLTSALGLVYGNSKTNIYDRILDPSSLSGGPLTYRESHIMKELESVAKILFITGQKEIATHLADICNHSSSIIPNTSTLDKPIMTHISPDMLYSNHAIVFDEQINTTNLSSQLKAILTPNQEEDILLKSIEKLKDKSKDKYMIISERGIGPMSQLPSLSMLMVEDWLGLRSKPDGFLMTPSITQKLSSTIASNLPNNAMSNFSNSITTSDNSSSNSNSGSSSSINSNSNNSNTILPYTLQSIPETWIGDIGQNTGKEQDKLVGYWRFSDVVYPNEVGFYNTNLDTRLLFTDLSKYTAINCLECMVSDNYVSTTKIENSTSKVDPGEDHEKVKALYDIVYPGLASNSKNSVDSVELRILCGRGGPLDIGLFHQDIDRNKLTLEMNLYCGYDNNNSSSQSNNIISKITYPIILYQRSLWNSTENPSNTVQNSKPIYSLSVESDGRLVWMIAENSTKEPIIKESKSNVLFDTNPNQSLKDTFEWKHIVLILSSSNISSTNSNVSIQISINNTSVISETMTVAMTYTESELTITYLSFARNLPKDWRFTELRLWSDIRSNNDIEENRENYLSIASKRKRQQMRLKGTKDLFRPLRDGFGGVISSLRSDRINLPPLKASIFYQIESTVTSSNNNSSTSIVSNTALSLNSTIDPSLSGISKGIDSSNSGSNSSSGGSLLSISKPVENIVKRPSIGLSLPPTTGSRLAMAAPPGGRRASANTTAITNTSSSLPTVPEEEPRTDYYHKVEKAFTASFDAFGMELIQPDTHGFSALSIPNADTKNNRNNGNNTNNSDNFTTSVDKPFSDEENDQKIASDEDPHHQQHPSKSISRGEHTSKDQESIAGFSDDKW